MTDERRRILELLSERKINVTEAEQLLNAASRTAPEAHTEEPRMRPKYLRIVIHRKNGDDKDISVRVPMTFVRSGLRLGAMIPGLFADGTKARLRERGVDIDLSKLDPVMLESMLDELGELNIDVESGRAQVRITAE